MNEIQRTHRNSEIARELHPSFRSRVWRVVERMERDGWRPRLQDGWRDPARQAALVKAGLSDVSWSFHSAVSPDGSPDSLAVHVYDDSAANPADPSRLFVMDLAIAAHVFGLRTGCTFGLTANRKKAIRLAISAGDRTYAGSIGWDACHLEPVGITRDEAQRGIRPS